MPSINLHLSTLNDLEELAPEELDLLASSTRRQRELDRTTNPDARDRSAELRDQRRSDRRKNIARGGIRRG